MADEKNPVWNLRDLFAGTPDDVAANLAMKRQELERLRFYDKQDWLINREFYKGNQYVWFNRTARRVESLPVDEIHMPKHRVRLVINQILPGIQYWVAQLTKNKPVISASPDNGSPRSLKAAQVAEMFYEYWWREFNLTAKLQSALTHSGLSQGYWLITWDALAGKSMEVMLNPQDGTPITDDDLADFFCDELEAMGVDPRQFKKVVYMGEIDVCPIPGENVLLDPAAKHFEDAQYAIVVQHVDPSDLNARYGINVGPDAIQGDETVPISYLNWRDDRPKTLRRLYCMWVRPQPALPKGKYVCWIEGPNQILEQGDWNLPINELPLVHFPGHERPDSAYDIPVASPAIPAQKELNRTASQIVEFKNLTINPQMLAPVGSLTQKLTNEPGKLLEYQPIQGMAPDWRQTPNLPNWVFEHLALISTQLDKCFNRIPSQRDQLPARIDSPTSIDLIQESVADQIATQIQRVEQSLVRAGHLMVALARTYYNEPRMIKLVGPGGASKVQKFLGADLSGGFSFHAEAGSGLPRTRAGKQARIEFLLQNQLIDPTTALKHLDVADMDGVLNQLVANEEQAEREHDKLLRGIPLNSSNTQAAIQAVNQGINPTTGQPLDSDDNPQKIIQQASIQPLPYEDFQAHLNVHKRHMVSAEFENYPPDAQQRFIDHYLATLSAYIQIMEFQFGDPPKVTMQLRSSVSAPAATAVLNKAGVNVTVDDVDQPPLDTWVVQDTSKPVESGTGNTPMSPVEQLQQMQQSEEQHQLASAKTAHEIALAQAKSAGQHQQNLALVAKAQQAQQLHEQKLQQLRQKKTNG